MVVIFSGIGYNENVSAINIVWQSKQDLLF